ncbi:MAG: hypothetical protein V1917_00265 [Candidatus Gottesmanbacteria bacterium]
MNNKIKLIIDSRDAKKTTISVVGQSFTDKITNKGANVHSQVILPLIERLIKKHDCRLADICAIEVCVDCGSFTGRRVGVVIATMLGSLLHIPVNGAFADTLVDIPYEEDKWK